MLIWGIPLFEWICHRAERKRPRLLVLHYGSMGIGPGELVIRRNTQCVTTSQD